MVVLSASTRTWAMVVKEVSSPYGVFGSITPLWKPVWIGYLVRGR